MGLTTPLLVISAFALSFADNICAVCVDKRIDFNPQFIPGYKIPLRMPNCSPGIRAKDEREIPHHIWLRPCKHACVSLNWMRDGSVADRLRLCSTCFFRNGTNVNATLDLPLMEVRRYPGLQIHVKFCHDEPQCNFDDGLIRDALLWEYKEPAPTGTTTTAVSTSSQAHATTGIDVPSVISIEPASDVQIGINTSNIQTRVVETNIRKKGHGQHRAKTNSVGIPLFVLSLTFVMLFG